uniref:Uncharacterized protein n=1 Tax=Quercus lobata TaxID=97700 RepID=A0A7N2LZZ8_QUELO
MMSGLKRRISSDSGSERVGESGKRREMTESGLVRGGWSVVEVEVGVAVEIGVAMFVFQRWSCLGSVEETRQNFDKMVDRDDISWTAVIDRYLEDGTMEEDGTMTWGKQVHGYMTRIGFDPLSFAASDLVHMYSKYATIQNAKRVAKVRNAIDDIGMVNKPGFSLLGYHSEKLAVAFGIISTPPETTIKLLTI